jgi:hypothetical protein
VRAALFFLAGCAATYDGPVGPDERYGDADDLWSGDIQAVPRSFVELTPIADWPAPTFTPSATRPDDAASDTLYIRNSGDPGSVLEFTIEPTPVGCPGEWLQITPLEGTLGSSDPAQSIAISYAGSGSCEPGTYGASVRIDDTDLPNTFWIFRIELTVD